MIQNAPFFYKEKFMAKRFYDSNKYDDAWFRSLTPDLKCVYDYCLCECNHAGILKLDIDAMTFKIKPHTRLTDELIADTFKDKFVYLSNNKIFIPKFLYWQYKNELTPANSVHRSVVKILQEEGIRIETYLAPYVLTEDFNNWGDLLREMKEDGCSYKDILNSRK